MFAAARRRGVPVNVIDRPAFCSFQFGAVVNRSPLVVGISTDGAAPVFGQAIRSRIEALLPAGFARWVRAAQAWRGDLQNLNLGPAVRRRFWERFATLALRAPERAPKERDRDELLAEVRSCSGSRAGEVGHVSLVGAGPGNPELLTLAAVRALRSADIILYDDLVAPEVLDFARREAKRMLVGKTGRRPSCRQDDINALMISLARSGKRVVRLKAGDPMIFGRAGEEIAALERANIPCDVVPGVTAAQGAAASLRVSLTHRQSARRVQYVTGHANDGRLPDDLDLAALADPAATTAVYMPLGTLGDLSARLLAHGVEPERPVERRLQRHAPRRAGRVRDFGDDPGAGAAERSERPLHPADGQRFARRACSRAAGGPGPGAAHTCPLGSFGLGKCPTHRNDGHPGACHPDPSIRGHRSTPIDGSRHKARDDNGAFGFAVTSGSADTSGADTDRDLPRDQYSRVFGSM